MARIALTQISRGMNQRDALQAARDLGCQVVALRRSGELEISHPTWGPKTIRITAHRKDSVRRLTSSLRGLVRLREADEPIDASKTITNTRSSSTQSPDTQS